MSEWTSGYVAEIGYTYGYYPELNPLRARLALLHAGIAPPEMQTACELGFGQGISVNIHAAAQSSLKFWATDFNPTQAGFANALATAAGSGARLFDQSFAEFCARDDLPEMDYIGLHGIWSWISDKNRSLIADFVRRKLKVGGVLYISYNTLPGWSTAAPIRHLLTEHAEVLGAPGQGIVERINASLAFADKLFATNPLYMRANPAVAERLKKITEQNRHYLAHEYFNRDWHPMPFAEMQRWLAPAKLTYACSAHYFDHVDALNLSPEQRALLQEIPDSNFRETVRDYIVNQQFRRDYWVKGPCRLNIAEQAEALRKQRIILLTPHDEVKLKVPLGQGGGEADMADDVYSPILELLADHQPKSMGQLEQQLREKGIKIAQIFQAAMILIGKGDVAPVQDDKLIQKAEPVAARLNAALLEKAKGSADIMWLASPVTGGGVSAYRFQQLFLLARAQGKKQPEEWAVFVWQLLEAQGQRLMANGQPMAAPEDNIAELTKQAKEFSEKRLPVLKSLKVA